MTRTGTGTVTTYPSMVLEESSPTRSSPGLTDRERSTLTMTSTGRWGMVWVCVFPMQISVSTSSVKIPPSLHPRPSRVGTDLLQVAAHEFGHVLGLQHSLEPGAIMSPFYSDSYPLRLSEDDTRGIQYLYGGPVHAPPEMTNEIDADMVRRQQHNCRSQLNEVHSVFILEVEV